MIPGKAFWTGKDSLVIVVLAMIGYGVLYFLLSFFIQSFSDEKSFAFFLMPSVIFHLITASLVGFLFMTYKIQPVEGLGRIPLGRLLSWAVAGGVMYGFVRFAHDFSGIQIYDASVRKLFTVPSNVFVSLIWSLTLGPVVEEVVWRGWVYPSLAMKARASLAVFFCALLNVIVVSTSHLTVELLIFSLLPALLFTAIRARTGSTFASMAAHFGFNMASALVFFVRLIAAFMRN